jgi:threonine dehydrogenase-like Zn-dependent dehydrogenase
MRALVLDGEPRVTEVPVPKRGHDEALIQVLAAGICNTDIELTRGYMGYRGILGHEFVGQVVEAANEQLVGKRVVGEINCVCHTCQFCQLEMPNHCLNRSVLGILNRNGAFAEFLTLPEENLHLVPNSIRDDVAVFTEPAAAAFRILEQVEILPADRVIVLGDGKLGQIISQVIWLKTKRLVCVGKHHWKLELLRKLNIATVHADDPLEGMADIVVDATGSYGGLQRALELVRPEGAIVLKTTMAHPTALELSGPVINEVRIIGSRCGPFRPALEALAMGNIEVRPMISESFSLSDAVDALARAQSPDVMKVILHM